MNKGGNETSTMGISPYIIGGGAAVLLVVGVIAAVVAANRDSGNFTGKAAGAQDAAKGGFSRAKSDYVGDTDVENPIAKKKPTISTTNSLAMNDVADSKPPAAEEWIRYKRDSDGKYYYNNPISGETKWSLPEGVKFTDGEP